MSDTPRTDAVKSTFAAMLNHAEQLERELAAAQMAENTLRALHISPRPEEKDMVLVPKIATVEMLAELASGITLFVRDQAPAPDLPTLWDRYQAAYTAMLRKAPPSPQKAPG